MQITGKNLLLVHEALTDALAEVRTCIGSCPDVVQYADDIEEYEALIEEYQRFQRRVERAMAK